MTHVTLHIGTPKTGTTTVQRAFDGQHPGRAVFKGPDSPDFPVLWVFQNLAGSDPSTDLPRARLEQADLARRWGKRVPASSLEARLSEILQRHDRVVLSHETITNHDSIREVLIPVLRRCGADQIDVLGYARHPIPWCVSELAHMASHQSFASFNLFLKGTRRFWVYGPWTYPQIGKPTPYRTYFASWDNILGEDLVHARLYPEPGDPSGISLVDDFARQTGLTPRHPVETLNQAQSAEQIAVLIALLIELVQDGDDGADPTLSLARTFLAGFGRRRLVMGPKAQDRYLDDHKDDIQWISARLGRDLWTEHPLQQGMAYTSLSDLRQKGLGVRHALSRHVQDVWGLRPRRARTLGSFFKQVAEDATGPDGLLKALPLGFDEAAYLRLHPDVARAGLSAKHHFMRYGFKEGREISIAPPA